MVDAENEETEKLQTISDIFSFEQVTASLVKRLDTIWSNFLNFVNQLNIEDVYYLAYTISRFHINKNFVVGRGIRTHATSASLKRTVVQ